MGPRHATLDIGVTAAVPSTRLSMSLVTLSELGTAQSCASWAHWSDAGHSPSRMRPASDYYCAAHGRQRLCG
jgi:hypothetical protein